MTSPMPPLTISRSLLPMAAEARKASICSLTVGVALLPAASGLLLMRALPVA